MGREVKRVAAGFDWPIGKVWGGFLNPFYQQSIECPANCDGGYSPEYIALKNRWYGYAPFRPEDRGGMPFTIEHPAIRRVAKRNVNHSPDFYGRGQPAIAREARRLCDLFNSQWSHHLNTADVAALVAAGRLHDLTHVFIAGEGWKQKDPPHTPTPEEVNAWSISGIGHDAVNCWVVIEAELQRVGQETTCRLCEGDGRKWPSSQIKQAYEDWGRVEPPEGEWWQVWETVSEGSPVTPAFATRDELITYLVEHGDAWDQKRGDGGWAREAAESFVGTGWAPSLIGSPGALREPRDGGIPALS